MGEFSLLSTFFLGCFPPIRCVPEITDVFLPKYFRVSRNAGIFDLLTSGDLNFELSPKSYIWRAFEHIFRLFFTTPRSWEIEGVFTFHQGVGNPKVRQAMVNFMAAISHTNFSPLHTTMFLFVRWTFHRRKNCLPGRTSSYRVTPIYEHNLCGWKWQRPYIYLHLHYLATCSRHAYFNTLVTLSQTID